MAISPPSDLILDVVRAAEPQAVQVAAQRLERLGAGAASDGSGFDLAMTATASKDATPFGHLSASLSGLDASTRPTADRARSEAAMGPAQKFEAVFLQQVVETMLPDDAQTVFGEGSTGEIWKSMMAEQIGNQIAASGGVGLAGLLKDTLKGAAA